MRLEDYFRSSGRARTQLDVFVQMMELYVFDGKGHGLISSDNYSAEYVESDDGSSDNIRFADISFDGQHRDSGIYALPYVPDDASEEEREKGDVFCLGLLMHKLRGREIPDLRRKEALLNMVGQDEFPLIKSEAGADSSVEESVICSLIARMTDLNVDTRPDMTECIAAAAKACESRATVDLVEKGTFSSKRKIGLSLKTPVTRWYPDEIYEEDGKRYIPVNPGAAAEIRYRVYTGQVINVYIVREKADYPEKWPVSALADRLCLGIDFGTWSSSVSFVNEQGLTEDVEFDGANHTPSAILYLGNDKCVFGREALEMAKKYPAALANCFKRRIETNEIYECTAVNGEKISEHYFKMAERFLAYLYEKCLAKFGERLYTASVTLTIPACYDPGMRTAIKEAASRAGFSPEPLTEPEAAAIFFGMRNNCDGKIIILDIGGGTTDVCLLNCRQGELSFPEVKVQYIGGAGQLGGVDFTRTAADKMLGDMLRREHDLDMSTLKASGLDVLFYEENMRRLDEAAENVKIALSSEDKAEVDLTLRFPDGSRRIVLNCRRRLFESLINTKITDLKKQIKNCIFSNGISPSDVSDLILTGGASVIPAVRRMASDMFKDTGCNVHYVDYPTVVSRGAAVYSNERCISSGKRQCINETNYDIGTVNNVPFSSREIFNCLIKAGTPFNGSPLEAKTECTLTEEEKKNGNCRVILYRRPRGYEHIESPFDAEGDVIRMIGSLYVPHFPDNFDKENGVILFHLIIDTQECIIANALFYNVKKNKKGETVREFVEMGNPVFVPLNEDLGDRI